MVVLEWSKRGDEWLLAVVTKAVIRMSVGIFEAAADWGCMVRIRSSWLWEQSSESLLNTCSPTDSCIKIYKALKCLKFLKTIFILNPSSQQFIKKEREKDWQMEGVTQFKYWLLIWCFKYIDSFGNEQYSNKSSFRIVK